MSVAGDSTVLGFYVAPTETLAVIEACVRHRR